MQDREAVPVVQRPTAGVREGLVSPNNLLGVPEGSVPVGSAKGAL